MACFELAIEDEGGEREFLFWEAERGAKEDLGRPVPGQSHEAGLFRGNGRWLRRGKRPASIQRASGVFAVRLGCLRAA